MLRVGEWGRLGHMVGWASGLGRTTTNNMDVGSSPLPKNAPRLTLTLKRVRDQASNDTATADLAQDVIKMLRAYPHFVILQGLKSDDGRALTEKLARAIANTAPAKSKHKSRKTAKLHLTRVENNEQKASQPIDLGSRYSRTNQPLTLHTDNSYMSKPYRLVVFHFVRVDRLGGDTLMAPVEDVIDALDEEVVQTLKQPIYPFGRGTRRVLWERNGRPNIRYYRTNIDEACDGYVLTDRALAAMEALDACLRREDLLFRFHAEPGETLFLHNTKVLHGRTGFAADSDRLMYRIRTRADCLV
jgi:alpha-ketoglutarate-dependent taurine dioxygenase